MDCSPIVLAHEESFSIGSAEIRPATRGLLFDGHHAVLEPRVMQMLVALHRADGGVVSKDDLIKLCWEGRVVGEDAINRVVSRLRHDAAKKAGGSFKVETITKVGYRLVTADGTARTFEPLKLRFNRRHAIAAAAVGTVAAGSAAWLLIGKKQLPSRAAELLKSGREAMREGTVDEYANAASSFRAATQIAPDSAEIWGALALAYALQAEMSSSEQRPDLSARSAAAADRALSIAPRNGDALGAKLLAIPVYGNWSQVEKEARSALASWPDHAVRNVVLASFLIQVGRNREALPVMERIMEIDPSRPRAMAFMSTIYWNVGRLDEAASTIERAFQLWPRHYVIWFGRFHFLAFNGRAQEALAMINDVASRPVGIPDWNFKLTALQAEAAINRDKGTIDSALAAWVEAARKGIGFAERAIMFAGAMGRPDTAFTILDAYYFDRGFSVGERRFAKEQGTYTARPIRYTDILFRRTMDSVQRDPRFRPLVEKIGLANYWRQSGTRPDYLA